MEPVLRISLWSCPRTVSTATLRSFANRPDTEGVDEPLYAWYLKHTGRLHPLREVVLRSQAQDWRTVVDRVLLGPTQRPVQFVKHMAHHLVGDVDVSFARRTANVFLIRDPREMLPSLRDDLGALHRADLGFERQRELYHELRRAGLDPVVVEGSDLLAAPERMLRALCERVGLAFTPEMLSWEPGPHPCYGAWAPAWYRKVMASSGFHALPPKSAPFPEELVPWLALARDPYRDLHARRLRP